MLAAIFTDKSRKNKQNKDSRWVLSVITSQQQQQPKQLLTHSRKHCAYLHFIKKKKKENETFFCSDLARKKNFLTSAAQKMENINTPISRVGPATTPNTTAHSAPIKKSTFKRWVCPLLVGGSRAKRQEVEEWSHEVTGESVWPKGTLGSASMHARTRTFRHVEAAFILKPAAAAAKTCCAVCFLLHTQTHTHISAAIGWTRS